MHATTHGELLELSENNQNWQEEDDSLKPLRIFTKVKKTLRERLQDLNLNGIGDATRKRLEGIAKKNVNILPKFGGRRVKRSSIRHRHNTRLRRRNTRTTRRH